MNDINELLDMIDPEVYAELKHNFSNNYDQFITKLKVESENISMLESFIKDYGNLNKS